MRTPLISVLMPVYNGESFLREAIQSILNQSFSDFEFLIIDDGSTDSSYEIILSFKDSRIRVYKNETNLGLIASLNKGVELSCGEFIARMDSDDVSYTNRLEKQLDFMKQHPDIGISGSWMHTSNLGKIVKYPETHEECKTFSFFNSPLAHPTVIFRKKIFIKHNLRYSSDYQVCEDIELWRRCMKFTKLGNLCEPLLYYRIHSSNVSLQNKSVQKQSLLKYYTHELESLGIQPNLIDLELHFAFIRPEITEEIKTKYNFKDFYTWSDFLLNLNIENKNFEISQFNKLLEDRLILIAFKYIKNGSIWYYYQRSNLTSNVCFFIRIFKYILKAFYNRLKNYGFA
ncbi:MAG: glycosyltransferase family 2 protein [Bacteroidales bacterium]